MLLLRRLGARRAEGVAVAMFGHTRLGVVPCQISLPATVVLTCPGLIEWQTIKPPIVVRNRPGMVFERASCH